MLLNPEAERASRIVTSSLLNLKKQHVYIHVLCVMYYVLCIMYLNKT